MTHLNAVKTWTHSRKGEITGWVVREDDEWLWVCLIGDHKLHYYSEAYRGQVDFGGDVMQLRKSLMREV